MADIFTSARKYGNCVIRIFEYAKIKKAITNKIGLKIEVYKIMDTSIEIRCGFNSVYQCNFLTRYQTTLKGFKNDVLVFLKEVDSYRQWN